MGEQRLVTLILCAIMALGATTLVIVFLTTSDCEEWEAFTSSHVTETAASDVNPEDYFSVRPPSSHDAVQSAEDYGPGDPASPTLPSAVLHEEVSETPQPGGTVTPPPEPPQAVIREASEANGTFSSAQEIEAGIILGRRGTIDDHGDYYRSSTTGDSMVLSLESVSEERDHGLRLSVFDENRRGVGEDIVETGIAVTYPVTFGTTCFIKLDLGHTPIETSQYRLHVQFAWSGDISK